jgi:hypothetical protein
MVVECAAKAELVSAVAVYCGNDSAQIPALDLAIYSKYTIR